MKKPAMSLALLFIFLATCCCSLSAGGLASQPLLGVKAWYGYSPDFGPGNGDPPDFGNCDNAGVAYPDNPYHGWPLDYQPGEMGLITFGFCALYPDGSPHWGLDFAVPEGTAALATAERSIVLQAQPCDDDPLCWNFGMGRYVQVDAQIRADDYDQCVSEHSGNPDADECWRNSGWLATYMHLSEVSVSVGQILRVGESVGTVGNTGNSHGTHLHFQINSPVVGAIDPALTLP